MNTKQKKKAALVSGTAWGCVGRSSNWLCSDKPPRTSRPGRGSWQRTRGQCERGRIAKRQIGTCCRVESNTKKSRVCNFPQTQTHTHTHVRRVRSAGLEKSQEATRGRGRVGVRDLENGVGGPEELARAGHDPGAEATERKQVSERLLGVEDLGHSRHLQWER